MYSKIMFIYYIVNAQAKIIFRFLPYVIDIHPAKQNVCIQFPTLLSCSATHVGKEEMLVQYHFPQKYAPAGIVSKVALNVPTAQ